MIIDDLPLKGYGYYDIDEIYQILIKEDAEILGYYFKNLYEIIFKTDEENIIKLRNNLNLLQKQMINFSLLPMFYELNFYISLKFENYKLANMYLRSFAFCIKRIKKIYKNIENIGKLEKNFKTCQDRINLYTPFKEKGNKDSLIKFFICEDLEKIQKEINIRVLMRTNLITRATALKYIKNKM